MAQEQTNVSYVVMVLLVLLLGTAKFCDLQAENERVEQDQRWQASRREESRRRTELLGRIATAGVVTREDCDEMERNGGIAGQHRTACGNRFRSEAEAQARHSPLSAINLMNRASRYLPEDDPGIKKAIEELRARLDCNSIFRQGKAGMDKCTTARCDRFLRGGYPHPASVVRTNAMCMEECAGRQSADYARCYTELVESTKVTEE